MPSFYRNSMFVALTQFLILIIIIHNSLEYNHSLKIKNHIHKRSSSNDNIDETLKGNTFLNAKSQQIFLPDYRFNIKCINLTKDDNTKFLQLMKIMSVKIKIKIR